MRWTDLPALDPSPSSGSGPPKRSDPSATPFVECERASLRHPDSSSERVERQESGGGIGGRDLPINLCHHHQLQDATERIGGGVRRGAAGRIAAQRDRVHLALVKLDEVQALLLP